MVLNNIEHLFDLVKTQFYGIAQAGGAQHRPLAYAIYLTIDLSGML